MAESNLLLAEGIKESERSEEDNSNELVPLAEIFSPDQMIDAILALRAKPYDTSLRDKIILSNSKLVYHFAIEMLNGKSNIGILELKDLCQEGKIGLMIALEKFDPDMGWKFSTYAVPWIRQRMQRAIRNTSQTIRVPHHIDEKLRMILIRRREMTQEFGQEPSIEEVIKTMGMTTAESVLIHKAWISRDPVSLDNVLSDGEYQDNQTLGNNVPGPEDPNPDEEIIRQQILDILDQTLTPREKRIMMLRFGIEDGNSKTLEEVGKQFDITRERVRQIEAKAIRKLQRCPDLESIYKDLIT